MMYNGGMKVKKILALIIAIVCIMSSFVVGFYFCKRQVIRGDTHIISYDVDRIAIVNLDEGVGKDNEKILYSNQLLKFTADYTYVSLNEAKKGIETGMYAAYIIIPADFSRCIESINGTPQKVKVEYAVNKNLTDENRLMITEKLNTFKEILSSNTAYVYLSSILSEFHDVQDSAAIIMEHDEKDLKNIQNINPDEIFTMIDFSETKQEDNDIENMDLTKYSEQNSTEVDNIIAAVNNGIEEGKKKYGEVGKQYTEVAQEINKVENTVSGYNPLNDANGNKVYQDGLDNLNQTIDEYNENINLEGAKGTEDIKKIIEDVAEQGIVDILKDVQKNTDIELEKIQNRNTEIISDTVNSFNTNNKEYYDKVDDFMKKQIDICLIKNNDIIDDMQNNTNNVSGELSKEKKDSYTKAEVMQYIEKVASYDLKAMQQMRTELEDSALHDGFNEELPELSVDSFPLPEVKIPHKEMATSNTTDLSDQEEDESVDNMIFIDVDKNVSIDKRITEGITNKEDDIAEVIDSVQNNFFLSKSDVNNIINEQIIGKIETENQNNINKYNDAATDLVTSIKEYDSKVTQFNPYAYIREEDINKHAAALSQNIKTMENAINAKNTEYYEFINKVYQTANENINTLQKDMQAANDASKEKLSEVIAKLKADKNSITQEDNDILDSFTKKLTYSRLGSLEYTEMYKFMVNPIETIMQSMDGKTLEETGENDIDLNYTKMLIGSIIIILLFIVFNLIIRILKKRKELKSIEDE